MAQNLASKENYSDVTQDEINNKYWKQKLELIKELKKLVGTAGFGKRRLNVLIIGAPGCGKSSLINTILTSFRKDQWNLYASVGKKGGAISNITETFKSYSSDKQYYKEEPNVLLPTFIDVNGLEDEHTSFNRDFLTALFNGKIQEKERLMDILELYSDDPSQFCTLIQRRREYRKIDRIIVVASADPSAQFPVNLYRCIRETAMKSGEIPIFGVMTKKDKFEDNEEVTSRIENYLGNLGITEDSFELLSNYCPDVDKTLKYHSSVNPQIDLPVLKFIKQVLNPHLDPVRCARFSENEVKRLVFVFLFIFLVVLGGLFGFFTFIFGIFLFVAAFIYQFKEEIPELKKVEDLFKDLINRMTEGPRRL